MDREQKKYWYWLSKVEEVGSVTRGRLFRCFDSPAELYAAGESALLKVEGLKEKARRALLNERYRAGVFEEFHKLSERGIYFVTKDEPEYPDRLRDLPQAPDFLFYRGELPKEDLPSVAIIGARECSAYGRGIAEEFAGELAAAGIQIISGMARGIDGYAQRAAIKYGRSYGVLGSGVDICYPLENYTLYEELMERGGILSEYPPGAPGAPYHFPMRNRLISGLSDGLVVVEARKKSGTLITVDYALEQGKEVFAVPGRLGDALSEGCNGLLHQGAMLAMTSTDIVEALLTEYPGKVIKQEKEKKYFLLAEEEKIVYAYLSLEPKHIEELLADVGMALSDLMKILFSLELRGMIYSPAGNYYAVVSRGK